MSKSLLIYCFILFDIFMLAGMYHLGIYEIISMDTSYITHTIIGIYLLTNILMLDMFVWKRFIHTKGLLDWTPSAMVSLGLLGTILGMFLVFGNLFTNLNFQDIENVKNILSQMVNGFSIAALTTIAGIGMSLLTTFKFIWFERQELEQKLEDLENEGN